MGGMNRGPITKGSSLMGSGSDLVPAPKNVGPTPRRIEARPMVAMTTAITGRPMSLRRTTRSSAKPKTIMLTSPSTMASQRGAPAAPRAAATTSPAIITNSPWAKFTASVALYTSTKPSAISAYISPMSTPFETSSRKKPRLPGMGRDPRDVLDPNLRADRGLTPILVRDSRGQLDLIASRVERVDHRRVLVGDEAAPHLPGARHLVVVGLEIFREQEEAADLRGIRKSLVHLSDLLLDQLTHFGFLREIHVGGVGETVAFGPVADCAEVDGDHGRHERALVAECDCLADEG